MQKLYYVSIKDLMKNSYKNCMLSTTPIKGLSVIVNIYKNICNRKVWVDVKFNDKRLIHNSYPEKSTTEDIVRNSLITTKRFLDNILLFNY